MIQLKEFLNLICDEEQFLEVWDYDSDDDTILFKGWLSDWRTFHKDDDINDFPIESISIDNSRILIFLFTKTQN